jgi:hypothetical protein
MHTPFAGAAASDYPFGIFKLFFGSVSVAIMT